jgi:hypothetical protein
LKPSDCVIGFGDVPRNRGQRTPGAESAWMPTKSSAFIGMARPVPFQVVRIADVMGMRVVSSPDLTDSGQVERIGDGYKNKIAEYFVVSVQTLVYRLVQLGIVDDE